MQVELATVGHVQPGAVLRVASLSAPFSTQRFVGRQLTVHTYRRYHTLCRIVVSTVMLC